jgi:hypothetical protein
MKEVVVIGTIMASSLLPAGCSGTIAMISVIGRLALTGTFLTPPASPADAY